MMKIILIIIIYIFFAFINSKIQENLSDKPCDCKSVPSLTDLQNQINTLSTTLTTTTKTANDALVKATSVYNDFENIKKNLVKE